MSDQVWDLKVSKAAESLSATGARVTAETVRRAIGHGSLRDICPALRRWREGRGSENDVSDAVPAELAKAFQAASATAWSVAERMANERIRAVEAVCVRRTSEAEYERDDALVSIARLEEQLDQMRQDLGVARAAATQAETAMARLESETAADREKLVWLHEALASEKQATADARALVMEMRERCTRGVPKSV